MTANNNKVLSGMSEFVRRPQSSEKVGMETYERLAFDKKHESGIPIHLFTKPDKNRIACTHHVQNARRSPADVYYYSGLEVHAQNPSQGIPTTT